MKVKYFTELWQGVIPDRHGSPRAWCGDVGRVLVTGEGSMWQWYSPSHWRKPCASECEWIVPGTEVE